MPPPLRGTVNIWGGTFPRNAMQGHIKWRWYDWAVEIFPWGCYSWGVGFEVVYLKGLNIAVITHLAINQANAASTRRVPPPRRNPAGRRMVI